MDRFGNVTADAVLHRLLDASPLLLLNASTNG
jgi:hypothetical protein